MEAYYRAVIARLEDLLTPIKRSKALKIALFRAKIIQHRSVWYASTFTGYVAVAVGGGNAPRAAGITWPDDEQGSDAVSCNFNNAETLSRPAPTTSPNGIE